MNKPKVLFFSRDYQSILFPLLRSEKYESLYVVLTSEEKERIENLGYPVVGCFNEDVKKLEPDYIEPDYLITSYASDRFMGSFNLDKRRSILGKEIAFWKNILDNNKPDFVINEVVAIEISEVIFIEAQKRGIKYLAWMNNPLNGYFYWTSYPMDLSLDSAVFSSEPTSESVIKAEKYLSDIVEKDIRPFYIQPFLKRRKIRHLISSTISILKTIIKNSFRLAGKRFQYEDYLDTHWDDFLRTINTFNFNYDNIDDYNETELVFFPIHFEPEFSLLYLAEFYSNQVALIENISKCLKTNQILVIKEHPQQPGMLALRKYKYLRKYFSNIIFLPSIIPASYVIKKSKLIITISSHLGWEALFHGKPVFLIGKMFYDKHPDINHFTNFEELRSSIRQDNFKYPDSQNTIKYMAQLLDYSYPGYPFPSDYLYRQENIELIIKAIESEITKNAG